MDRHHAAIAAVLATHVVACKEDEPGPLFEGSESLELGPATVEGDDTRAWKVTAEVALPRQAEPSTWQSALEMDMRFSTSKASMDAAFVVRECDGGTVHANLSVPPDGEDGSTSSEWFDLPHFLADCPIQEVCVRTMCVEATNHRNASLELSVDVLVTLRSDAPADDDSDTIDVPIELTVEEIVPP